MKAKWLSLIGTGLALLIMMSIGSSPALAIGTNYYFASNTTGDFNTAANWYGSNSYNAVPDANDTIYVLTNGSLRITANASCTNAWIGCSDIGGLSYRKGEVGLINGVFSNAGNLYIGGGYNSSGYGSGSFFQVSGTCYVDKLTIAYNGVFGSCYGAYVMSNGHFVIRNTANSGPNAGFVVGCQGTGRLEVIGGTIDVRGHMAVGVGAPTATVVQSGGSVFIGIALSLGSVCDSTYYLSGGSLIVSNPNISAFGGTSSRGQFIQTGGNVKLGYPSYDGMRLANSNSLWEISGGSLTSDYQLINFVTGSIFRIVGSAPSVTVPYFTGMNTNSCWEYLLDKSSPHIAKIVFTNYGGTGLKGYLKVGLRGGVLLASTNYFPLVQCYNSTSIWNNLPDTNMWAWYRSGGDIITGLTGVRLNTNSGAYYGGQVDMNGSTEFRKI